MKKIFFFSLLFISSLALASDVKETDLAGSWYPASGSELSAMLQRYLDGARPEEIKGEVIALISPHAGYQFSGPVAAYGFKALQGRVINSVVVIGFSHRRSFDGISVYDRGSWKTPLGDVRIDEDLAKRVMSANARIRFEPGLFIDENSVEMLVPFIQQAFKGASIVPIAFGTQDYGDAELLAVALSEALRYRNDVLVVASTDLSHYHSYDEANAMDGRTINMLKAFDARKLYNEGRAGRCELCGLLPVAATLLMASELGYDKIAVLKYANSGDTCGDKSRVVGYLSAAIYRGTKDEGRRTIGEEKNSMLNENQRKRLLQIARESVTSYVRDGKTKQFKEDDPVLNEPMGAFVTLHEAGELRGCIGNMVARGPLYQTVADMAVESATGDPRFPTLSAAEIDKIDIEISVLSPMKKVKSHEEVVVPGHGVLVRRGFSSGVYLPQVATETGWNKEQFLSSLCSQKAGLPPDAWKDPGTEIYVFSAEVFGEKAH